MNPLRAFAIGLFLLLLAACEEESTTGQQLPLPYPGTYQALVQQDGDTLELTLVYADEGDRTLTGRNAAVFTIESGDLYGGYKPGVMQGSLFTTSGNPQLDFPYAFNGQTLSGPMTLSGSELDIHTTVTFKRR